MPAGQGAKDFLFAAQAGKKPRQGRPGQWGIAGLEVLSANRLGGDTR
jgi:hypothetical protein